MHVHALYHMRVHLCDFAAETNVAEGSTEAGGEGGVTKLLEQQTLEDKEREDGEEGKSSPSSSSAASVVFTCSVLKVMMLSTDADEGENAAGKSKKKRKKKKGCKQNLRGKSPFTGVDLVEMTLPLPPPPPTPPLSGPQ